MKENLTERGLEFAQILNVGEMKMDNVSTGIFLRGILLGTKLTTNTYREKQTGNMNSTSYTEIGIEVEFMNAFNTVQKVIKTARLTSDKEKDAAFMKSLVDHVHKFVELPVNLADYRNIYVEKNAVLVVIKSQDLKQAS